MNATDTREARKDHVAVRLGEATQARIEALRPQLSLPWHEATTSDVLRAVIRVGLELAEKEPDRLRALTGTN